jgi:hypothetical protein
VSIPPRSDGNAAVIAIIVALCAACAGDPNGTDDAGPTPTDTSSDMDTDSDTETDSDTGDPIPGECPTALVPPCGDGVYQLPRIFAAEDLGAGYTLVDATPSLVLAERDVGGSNEVATFATLSYYFDIWDPPSWWEEPPWNDAMNVGTAHAIGAVDVPYGVLGDDAMSAILVCREDASCDVHLLRVVWNDNPSPDEVVIDSVPTWSLPAELAARAIVPSNTGVAYVVGNGAVELEYDGTVYGLVASDTGAPLRDGVSPGIFVGEGGRIAESTGEEWLHVEEDSGTDAGLLAIEEQESSAFIAASDGTVGAGSLGDLEWTPLAEEPLVEIAVASEEWPSYWDDQVDVLTASGCVLSRGESVNSPEEFCLLGVLPEPGIRIVHWPCEYAHNTTFLTPHGMYGDWDCYSWE